MIAANNPEMWEAADEILYLRDRAEEVHVERKER